MRWLKIAKFFILQSLRSIDITEVILAIVCWWNRLDLVPGRNDNFVADMVGAITRNLQNRHDKTLIEMMREHIDDLDAICTRYELGNENYYVQKSIERLKDSSEYLGLAHTELKSKEA